MRFGPPAALQSGLRISTPQARSLGTRARAAGCAVGAVCRRSRPARPHARPSWSDVSKSHARASRHHLTCSLDRYVGRSRCAEPIPSATCTARSFADRSVIVLPGSPPGRNPASARLRCRHVADHGASLPTGLEISLRLRGTCTGATAISMQSHAISRHEHGSYRPSRRLRLSPG